MKKSEDIYLYDGSLEHLLSLILFLFQKRILPRNIKPEDYQPNLLEQTIYLDVPLQDNVFQQIQSHLGQRVLQTVSILFLANHPHKEFLIFSFLLYSRKYKQEVFHMYPVKAIATCLKVTKQVYHEYHRMTGFLRFKELADHTLYATFAPDHAILELVAKHFKKRFLNERWIIKDVKRDFLCIYDKKNLYFVHGKDVQFLSLNYSSREDQVEELWKEFYKTIGIESRRNERCRRNFMPKKYWKYILEVSEENETSSNKGRTTFKNEGGN